MQLKAVQGLQEKGEGKTLKILVTGGCGNIGPHVVKSLKDKGHEIRVVDINEEGLKKLAAPGIETMAGDISNKDFIFEAVKGMDAVIHLAWSFSNNILELFDVDVRGYAYILDAAEKYNVEHVINASTAVVYGKPQYSPVDENHPRIVEKARKPMYALAKLVTEKLGTIYALEKDMAINTIMIWYAYGNEIGGKHLRNMVKSAILEGKIVVPKDCGGSFLQLDDLVAGIEGIFKYKPKGELFNLATIYLTWEELAKLIVERANPNAQVVAVPKEEWTGSTFLTDDWEFSTKKAEEMLGYKTHLSKDEAVKHLGKALEVCIAEVKASL